jgi:hypothetical protein
MLSIAAPLSGASLFLPLSRTIEAGAFSYCTSLTDVDLPKDLETMGENAFLSCRSLRRIVIPLKDDMIGDDVFLDCEELQRVDLVGGGPQNYRLATPGEVEE